MNEVSKLDTILTGVRSNEEPTIANYLGGFLPMIEMQKEHSKNYRIHMFVPDLHSFTTPIDHTGLYERTLQNVKYYLAAGLDGNDPNTFVYRQSFIPAHSELTWILDCFTGFGEMARMTQFKDKSGNQKDVSVGLFNYPVLMAADILLYNARYVPVGEDQFQHLEITRDIAERFNRRFGNIFVIPEDTVKQTEFIKRDKGLRIRSLTDPEKKMSKSDENPKSQIMLTDSPDAAVEKIMSATTDSQGEINFDFETQPGISSLLQVLAMLSGESQEVVNQKWQGVSRYGDFKKEVADAVHVFLTDFHNKLNDISDDEVLDLLIKSENNVRLIAEATLLRAQKAVGLRKS